MKKVLYTVVAFSFVGFSKADEVPSYLTDVRPILAKNCFACHGADEHARKGELRLDIPAADHDDKSAAVQAIVAGRPAESELVARITSSDADTLMPPPDSGQTLTERQIKTLQQWIAAGAEYETHWAFLTPVRSPLPEISDGGWCRNGIDPFILQQLLQRNLKPTEVADPYTLIRRVCLDLTGLPPTPELADAFAKDPSPAAFEKTVDVLLASPRFGEHWAAMWLDLARYADTKGYEKDQPRNIWRYRDWVIDAFNKDMPFDQFTKEQIAGDLLPNATSDQFLATAFHRNTLTNDEGGTDNEEYRIAAVKDRVDTTVQVWMGLTMGCARCHSHKYDPISQTEYYQFLAFFNQTEDADRPDDSPRLATPTVEQRQQLAVINSELTELRETYEAKSPEIQAAEKRLKNLNNAIVATPIMRDLPLKKQRETFIHLRGNFLEAGERVQPGFPATLAIDADTESLNRLSVADWLTSPQNPLTARVAVNRIWSRFLGRGLVETEEDFGTQGMLPTHPELLDWLAVEFRDVHKWSMKQLCKTIVMSATYQQSSVISEAAARLDPENRWLSRGARFRLSAEALRDQALFCSDLLSNRIGGPSVMPPQPGGIWRTTYSKLKWETAEGEDRYRRAIYTFLRRTSPYPSMLTFDGTSREVCQIRRIRTNTPLQALVMLNDPVYLETAGALADASRESASPILHMFRRVLIRPPTAMELQRISKLYADTLAEYEHDTEAAKKIIQQVNLQEIAPAETVRMAALSVVANVLLNLDEFMMRP